MATELRPRKLFMYAEGLLTHFSRNGWKADYSIPTHILELSMMRQLSTMMMMKIQCCNALVATPLKNIVHILARNLYQLLYLENVVIIIMEIN